MPYIIIVFVVLVVSYVVIKFVVDRINRSSLEDYEVMMEDEAKSNSGKPQKHTFIFFKKRM